MAGNSWFAGLVEIRAIYEGPHMLCFWFVDGQTNKSGASPQGFGTVKQVWGGFDLL